MTLELRRLNSSNAGEDFDLVDGALAIELSRGPDGTWTFWGVRIGDSAVGIGRKQTLNPHAGAWLDTQHNVLANKAAADGGAG